MPNSNMNLMQASKKLEHVKGEVRTRTDRAKDDNGDLNSELFKYKNPDVELSMGDWLSERYEEAEKLQREVNEYMKTEGILGNFDQLDDFGKQKGHRPPTPGGGKILSLADALLKSDTFESFSKTLTLDPSESSGVKAMSFDHSIGLKTLFESNANAANTVNIESIRTGEYEMLPRTRITLLDIIPQAETMFPVVKYDNEVLNESNVQNVAQGAVYQESAFTINEATVDVSKSGAFIQVSEEAMQDRADLQARLNGSMMMQLMRRVQDDIIGAAALVNPGEYVGTPTVNANVTGFLETTGINTIDGTSVNQIAALHNASELVYRVGQAEPTAIVMNSQDWASMKNLQATTGTFVVPGANNALYDGVRMALDGMPVVLCNALPANTVLVGDFANHCMLRDRQAAQVRIQEAQAIPVGAINTTVYAAPSGRFNVYCDVRYAFYVRRAAAFTSITNFGQ